MKTIGLIGGMSWESTVTYYQIINETIKRELGGLHSAKILLYSVDFDEIEKYQADGDWDRSADILSDVAIKLEKAGADYIVICTNTMHKIAPQMSERISIPIIHIAEATADKLKEQGISTVGLLGTKYTMTEEFYKAKLIEAGINVLIPNDEDVQIINSIIYNELCLGNIRKESKDSYLTIIKKLEDAGAQGVILGCTEIGLLIQQKDIDLPVFDTTLIHAEKAALLSID
ncbi:MAG: aspartate/glutamate racemase family protein [Pseudobutyrivibrio sp.]|nr:aspartate/glutamate racemase family protein [Pseudobutyrivibrio sp.]